jgi:hypothetical protein
MFFDFKYFSSASFRKSPMSPNFKFPLASFPVPNKESDGEEREYESK